MINKIMELIRKPRKKKKSYNVITAKCVEGKYKDSYMELDIGKTGWDSSLKMNGKKVKYCISADIKLRAGEETSITLVFDPNIKE